MPSSRESLAAVRRLLAETVDSFEKLETLVHLHRARAGTQTSTAIAQALGLSGDAVVEALAGLMRDGLVRTTGEHGAGWWFDANGPRATAVGALVNTYDEDRMEVLKLMTELAFERVRGQTAQRFADAFVIRLRKRKGDPDA